MASLNPQDSYEQLKRKNRRRLVGAVAMVAVAAALLLSVLNQNKTPASQQQEVLITGLNTDASAITVSTGSDVTAASASDANLAPGTVLEPQPESDNQAASQATTVAEKPAPVAGSLPPVVVTKPAATPTQQVPVQARLHRRFHHDQLGHHHARPYSTAESPVRYVRSAGTFQTDQEYR